MTLNIKYTVRKTNLQTSEVSEITVSYKTAQKYRKKYSPSKVYYNKANEPSIVNVLIEIY